MSCYVVCVGGSSLIECPANSYCVANSSIPVSCPSLAMISLSGSNNITSCECSSGSYGGIISSSTPIMGSCSICGIGSYCSGGNHTSLCVTNRTTITLGSVSINNCICINGTMNSTNIISSSSSDANQPCITCSSGYYCNTANAIRVNQTNMWRNGTNILVSSLSSTARLCPIGYYCPSGSSEPFLCPLYSTTLLLGASSINDCQCLSGYYRNVSSSSSMVTCNICMGGYYCYGGNNAPIICDANYYCPIGSSTTIPCGTGNNINAFSFNHCYHCSLILSMLGTCICMLNRFNIIEWKQQRYQLYMRTIILWYKWSRYLHAMFSWLLLHWWWRCQQSNMRC